MIEEPEIRTVEADLPVVAPLYGDLLIKACYHLYPDLFMPDSVMPPKNLHGDPFPHEKYIMWRLGVDSLEDVVHIRQLIIDFDPEAPPALSIKYSANPAYCVEHRTYGTAMDGSGYPHYFSHHGMTEDQWLETRHW